jgi:hypothetical protein
MRLLHQTSNWQWVNVLMLKKPKGKAKQGTD